MAGTLFGIGLSQQIGANGTPLSGALLYVYDAGTSTPAATYTDFGLTTEHPFPIAADSAGRIPAFYVADGTYRARLTTSGGVEIFDEDAILAIGASSGASSGSGSATVDSTAILQTGDTLWVPVIGTRTGFVRANGRTIGSGASGATERANADTQDLFEFCWNTYSNTICAVSGGRGASAAADFSANKTLTLYSMRGRAAFGFDDMGGSAASVISGATTYATGGAATVTLTTAHLPNYNLSIASLTGSVGTTITNGTNVFRNANDIGNNATGGGGNAIQSGSSSNLSLASGTVTFGGTLPSGGGGSATTIISPYFLGTWYIKL